MFSCYPRIQSRLVIQAEVYGEPVGSVDLGKQKAVLSKSLHPAYRFPYSCRVPIFPPLIQVNDDFREFLSVDLSDLRSSSEMRLNIGSILYIEMSVIEKSVNV